MPAKGHPGSRGEASFPKHPMEAALLRVWTRPRVFSLNTPRRLVASELCLLARFTEMLSSLRGGAVSQA